MLRFSAPLLVVLAACNGTVGSMHGHETDGGASDLGAVADGGARDLGASGDASAADLGATGDAGATDLGGPPPIDACTPRDPATCGGGECGTIPGADGCGGDLACAACGDAYDVYCTVSASAMHQAAVTGAVNDTMTNHPELFDPVMFRDTSSWLVIDDAGYTAAVVAACNAMGVVCLSDPNDDHEIRVHGLGDHLAENYGIRVHSTNRTWTRFMGGYCETTLF